MPTHTWKLEDEDLCRGCPMLDEDILINQQCKLGYRETYEDWYELDDAEFFARPEQCKQELGQ